MRKHPLAWQKKGEFLMQDHCTPDCTPLKHCPKCDQDKPATAEYFARNKNRIDGFQCWCKMCRKEHYIANKEYIDKRNRAYNDANKERMAEYYRAYRAANKQSEAERNRAHRVANKDHYTKYRRAHHEANKEHDIEQGRIYYAAHKKESFANAHLRRARILKAKGSHTAADVTRQYETQRGLCAYCSCEVGDTYHVDHVLALTRGGSNNPDNLVITCPSCNHSKWNKLLYSEWMPPNPLPMLTNLS